MKSSRESNSLGEIDKHVTRWMKAPSLSRRRLISPTFYCNPGGRLAMGSVGRISRLQGRRIIVSRWKIASLVRLRDSGWYTSLAQRFVTCRNHPVSPALTTHRHSPASTPTAATCYCLESSKSPRETSYRTRTPPAGSQSPGIIDQNFAHHLTACCSQLPWRRTIIRIRRRIDFFSRLRYPLNWPDTLRLRRLVDDDAEIETRNFRQIAAKLPSIRTAAESLISPLLIRKLRALPRNVQGLVSPSIASG